MNAATLRQGITAAAAHAAKWEPTDISQRARCFVAALSGWMQDDEPALYNVVWGLLQSPKIEAESPLPAADVK
jgi:hypothetical protein